MAALALLDTCRDIRRHAEDLADAGVGCPSNAVPAPRASQDGSRKADRRGFWAWFRAVSLHPRLALVLSFGFIVAAAVTTPRPLAAAFALLGSVLVATSENLRPGA
jgi:hypothetical protein